MVARKKPKKNKAALNNDGSDQMSPIYNFTRHHFYYAVACRAMHRSDILKIKISELHATRPEIAIKLTHLQNEQDMALVTTLVFSAMSLEAFMYSYACSRISREKVDKLDRELDLKTKFLRYPEEITGKQPRKTGKGAAYPLIANLAKLRNELVHYKQKSRTLKGEIEAQLSGEFISEKKAKQAIYVVRLAIKELFDLESTIHMDRRLPITELYYLDEAEANSKIIDDIIEHDYPGNDLGLDEYPSIDPGLDD